MSKIIRIGTRPSRLALKQVDEIKERFPHFYFEVITIKTKGDRDKITPLSEHEKSDFFTYEIEKALIEGVIDVAVHSAKDLEKATPKELILVAVTHSISLLECLISKGNFRLKDLPSGSVVGTSSKKRKEAIINFRRNLVVKDIRGNIDERLSQFDRGDFDAIIVAHAALLRLGYEERISEIIPRDIIEPHPLQGRLAIQTRHDRQDMVKIFRSINETHKR